MTKKELRDVIDRASRHVSSWPPWKQNILAHSSMPTLLYARSPVIPEDGDASVTKKEQAVFDAAIERAETLAALRWTEPVERDVMPPKSLSETLEGWEFSECRAWDSLSKEAVYPMWTESACHGTRKPHDYIASHGSRQLFSTELLALKALRHAIELKAANTLRQIDARIEAAKKGVEV